MKRIGYISGARIRGSVDLGAGGNLTVPGTLTVHLAAVLALGVNVYGASLFHSSLGVAGATNLNGAVLCSSTLAIAGTLTMPPAVFGTLLPLADPTVAGRLWVNAGVVTRSAG